MTSTSTASALSTRFASLKAQGRQALVCYVTAGHPDRTRSLELMRGLEAAGADVLEVGVPFSDPMADGPVIQESSQVAIAGGMSLDGTLELIAEAKLNIPVVLFSYLNPIMAAGRSILERARDAGVDGILITDLPVGADAERESWLGTSGLDFIRLVAPTTPAERMEEISRNGGGFVYLISRMGVTGEQSTIASDLPDSLARLRSVTKLPVCVGFGISTPEQAASVAKLGDGVVVGSALVRAANKSNADAFALIKSMRAAMDASANVA
jgi:tryptophan synthase alpha chain